MANTTIEITIKKKEEKEESIEDSKEDKCRICLDIGTEPLKKRCECNSLCHDSCLLEWINTRKDENSNICEICKKEYNSNELFKNKINEKNNNKNRNLYDIFSSLSIIVQIMTIFLITSCCIWLIYFLSWIDPHLEAEGKNRVLYFCIIMSIVICIFLSIIYITK